MRSKTPTATLQKLHFITGGSDDVRVRSTTFGLDITVLAESSAIALLSTLHKHYVSLTCAFTVRIDNISIDVSIHQNQEIAKQYPSLKQVIEARNE